ncbi:MAG TPA: hypothetical protein VMI11_06840 [Actinomycetes bacterium]|nr:hypothetical protein [Actinomycetes bacterium]
MSETHEQPRDAGNWAPNVGRLEVGPEVAAAGFNVSGRKVTGPQQGFGKLWQRTYATELGSGIGPQAVIADWKQNFGSYWPKGATFHTSLTGVSPGSVNPIGIDTGAGMTLSTGILVLYADDESFTFMTPEGHMFAGMITFGAESVASGTEVSIRILIRTNDPLYELGWPVMRRKEDQFWVATLKNLAAHHGVPDAEVSEYTVCVDRKRLWGNWRNVRHNAGMRSAAHTATAPLRALRRTERG